MIITRTAAFAALASLVLALQAASASAQVVIQGEVTAQPDQGQVQGNVVVTQTPPPAYGGYTDAPAGGYAVQPQQVAPQCPAGAQMMPNRWGQPVCMHEVTSHRVSGGLLGGGIGLLAGGYVLEVFVTLFSGIVGAFSTGPDYTAEQLNNYVTFGFIPVIGPWVQLGFAPPFADTSLYAVLVLEALAQAGGIVMIVFGVMGEDVTEWRPVAGLDLRVRPMLGQTNGLSAELRF
ncbi:MAG: hypothetical protein K1X94_11645 [Sandaracinaceae bacterium]|nr:hypothetical protein [Sandaracinaceae bacterium]